MMEANVKKILTGAVLAIVLGGVAHADNFVVVRSSDPAVAARSMFTSGQTVSVRKGASLTVINGAGALSTLTSRSGAITLPGAASEADAQKASAMRAILERPQARRTFGAMRGGTHQVGDCPLASELKTMDDIIKADADDCNDVAQEALAAFVANGDKK